MPSIEALSPIFGPDAYRDRVCTHAGGERNLAQLGARLAGTPDLVGLYATEDAEPGYQPDPARAGRVVALARLLPMPPGRAMRDYPSGRMGDAGHDHWPFGWPAETVFAARPGSGPVLRDAVELVLGLFDFADFTASLRQGPVDLRLMPALRNRLMREIEQEIARDPASRLLPF